jgi:hypothetical protein
MLAGCDYYRPATFIQPVRMAPRPMSRATIAPPVRELLVAPEAPDCEFKTNDPNADERQKLDYERQCYRHAEMIARERLQLLQASVRRMAKAVDRCQWAAAQPGERKRLVSASAFSR